MLSDPYKKEPPEIAQLVNKDGQLPLHTAPAFAEDFFALRQILDIFSFGASHTDKQGRLPMHYFMEREGGPDCLCLNPLHSAYPDRLEHQDCLGNTPMHLTQNESLHDWAIQEKPHIRFIPNINGEFLVHLISFRRAGVRQLKKLLGPETRLLAQPNVDEGNTPLHNAILQKAGCRVIKWMVERNTATLAVVNKQGLQRSI